MYRDARLPATQFPHSRHCRKPQTFLVRECVFSPRLSRVEAESFPLKVEAKEHAAALSFHVCRSDVPCRTQSRAW